MPKQLGSWSKSHQSRSDSYIDRFRNYLAAKHLANLPLKEQLSQVKERFRHPQWHDVLLCLSHLNTRSGDVDELVSIVEELELPIEMESARQSFLAEIAFGDLHCSPSVARRLAKNTFEAIEIGVQEGIRKRLVELTLDGLESDALRSLVESRIRTWYPMRHRDRRWLYEAVASEPRNDEALAILWRGLFDEEHWNRRAAADSLSKILKTDPSEAEKAFTMLFKPAELNMLAYVLHSLCVAIDCDGRLPEILRDLRECPDSSLQSVALIHRVRRNEHDWTDQEILIRSLRELGGGAREWKEDRARALIAGWPGDAQVKGM